MNGEDIGDSERNMPRLIMKIDDKQLNDDTLQEDLSNIATNDEVIRFVKAMLNLMKSGDLGFWMSQRLTRKIKAANKEHKGNSSQSTREIDEESFLLFLREGGSIEPNIRWEVESLPNNSGIYRMLLQGGKNEDDTGVHNN